MSAIIIIKSAIIYTVATERALACLCIKFFFLVFLYKFSIPLQGIYNKYAINKPTKNGAKTENNVPIHSPICVKLSNNL